MKSLTDLKWTLSRRTVLITIVSVMYVWNISIPCSTMLLVVHAKQLYYQVIYNFRLSICLYMEGFLQRKSCIKLLPESLTKGADKSSISVKNNGRREAIMFPHMFEEEMRGLLCCRSILAWYKYSHLGKSIDYY